MYYYCILYSKLAQSRHSLSLRVVGFALDTEVTETFSVFRKSLTAAYMKRKPAHIQQQHALRECFRSWLKFR